MKCCKIVVLAREGKHKGEDIIKDNVIKELIKINEGQKLNFSETARDHGKFQEYEAGVLVEPT